jgi:hypothetical protein
MCSEIVVGTWQHIGHVSLTTQAKGLVNSSFVSLAFVDLKGDAILLNDFWII